MAPTAPERAALADKLTAGAEALHIALSAAQIGRLLDYVALLVKWNAVYNLTAVREPMQMVTQHLLDSLAALPAFAGARQVLDVGAGGGLPGMVLAIWAAEAQPALQVALIDTVHKKTAFLTQAKAELGLANVSVHTGRVEQMSSTQQFDVITSRAFAELADFIDWSGHLLAPGGRFIALKGLRPDAEIARLPVGWRVTAVQPLQVPGLNAERHLVLIEKTEKHRGAAA
jgi:16S rRNA (guanine527-N7)-methyltransferase